LTVWQLTVWFCRLFDIQTVNLFGYWLNFSLLHWLIDYSKYWLFILTTVYSFDCWLFKFLSVWVSIVWFLFFAIKFFCSFTMFLLWTGWIVNSLNFKCWKFFLFFFCQSFCSTVKRQLFKLFNFYKLWLFNCLTVWHLISCADSCWNWVQKCLLNCLSDACLTICQH
jgi:hypothetical protein